MDLGIICGSPILATNEEKIQMRLFEDSFVVVFLLLWQC